MAAIHETVRVVAYGFGATVGDAGRHGTIIGTGRTRERVRFDSNGEVKSLPRCILKHTGWVAATMDLRTFGMAIFDAALAARRAERPLTFAQRQSRPRVMAAIYVGRSLAALGRCING